MTLRRTFLCSALAFGIGLSLAPTAHAAESGGSMSKMSSGGMTKTDTMMKKHKKHKDSMMSGDAMKKDEAPAQ